MLTRQSRDARQRPTLRISPQLPFSPVNTSQELAARQLGKRYCGTRTILASTDRLFLAEQLFHLWIHVSYHSIKNVPLLRSAALVFLPFQSIFSVFPNCVRVTMWCLIDPSRFYGARRWNHCVPFVLSDAHNRCIAHRFF